MNNFMNFMQMIGNPQQFLSNMVSNTACMNNPIMRNGFELYQKGDMKALENLVNNVAKEKGVSINDIKQQLGMK